MQKSPFRKLSEQASGQHLPQPKEDTLVTKQETEPEPTQVPAIVDNPNKFLIEQLGENVQLTEIQKAELSTYMGKARLGMSMLMMPLICKDNCPFMAKCPLHINKIPLPINKPCPVEIAVMKQYRDELACSIGVDGNDVNSAFDRKLLDDLALIHMIKMRCGIELGVDDVRIGEDKAVSFSPQGEKIYATVINPRIGVLEKLLKLEKQIMTELMATRRAKFQATGNPDDASKVGATLMGKMEEAMAIKMKAAQEKNRQDVENIIDADYTVKE